MTTRRQNSRLSIIAVLLSVACPVGLAQSGDAAPAPAPGSDAAAGAGLPIVEIQKLVAPIALYPDVLVSQILPAATFPTQIVQAARWCKDHPDLKGLDDQPWDLSVISVCRYAPILSKMDQDLDWTNAIGSAFMDQPDDVMSAIQTLRDQAKDAGVLKTTPQQTVVSEDDAIRIVPTEKEVIYVPQYDPQVIYVEDDDDDDDLVVAGTIAASALSFTAGMAMGAWLDNDCDWHGGCVVGCRPGYWGGWGYRGAVAWDNDWYAARGARRGVVAGPNGGAYVGPRGAAVWGDNGRGAAWSRGGYHGAPAYTGRYAGYNNVAGNRRNVAAGNTVNVNRNNVNIDRGDRTNVGSGNRTNVGGDRTNIGGGDRNNVGGGDRNRPGDGNRPNAGGGDNRPRPGDGNRPNSGGGDRPGAGGGDRPRPGDGNRPNAGGGDRPSRPQQPSARPAQQPSARPAQQPSARPKSTVGDQRSSSQVQRSSDRGSSSRGGGGGGSRGGGGRRGR